MTTNLKTRLLQALACAALLAGCGGGGGIGGTGIGKLRYQLTDAPACGYDAVHLTIEKIRVHQSSSAGDGDGGWVDLALTPAHRVDLLTLTNGVLDTLGEVSLPAGRYTQMRLVLAANGGSTPLANSVTPTGGAETALTTPSAQQSGLKLNIDVDVPADKVLDAVIDFDACKSVVKRGNSGQYNLKPVISVTPVLADAGLRVTGYVDPLLVGATVSVQAADGTVLKATVPSADPARLGQFVLYPVPVGTYSLVIGAAGRVNAVLTGVPVTSTAYTVINTAAAPIVLPALAAPAVPVAGTVTPATATVRALQTLTGGTAVELAWPPVDALSGAFATTLPLDAPLRAAYVANTAPAFAADAAVAGRYTLQAQNGAAVLNQAVDVNAAVPPVTFTFP